MLQRTLTMPDRRWRLLVSAAVGIATGTFCWFLMKRLNQGAADFSWAIRQASDLLAGRNPYQREMQLYPLPAALFGLPFTKVPAAVAAGIFYGLSSAALAFGITRFGYHRLLIFAAYPYWSGMLTVQWIPLIMASAFLFPLSPSVLAKPQIGLPIALTRMGRKGAVICVCVLILSFLVMPHWVQAWLGQAQTYVHFIPLLVFPGMVLALALIQYKDRDAWLLFLTACMPQRWFYDAFVLWLIPRTRRAIIFTAGISWIPGIWRWYHTPQHVNEVGRAMILCFYIPILVDVLLRRRSQQQLQSQGQPAQIGSDGSSATSAPTAAG